MDISKEELYKAIGTKIRAMRTAKGWTQEELGNKFDVSPQYISRIERGSAHLPAEALRPRGHTGMFNLRNITILAFTNKRFLF